MTDQQQEQTAPVDWQAIAQQRERELKKVGETRHRAEAERDEARQHAAAIAAQRDRLRMRMNALADRWDTALAVDKPYARALRAEITTDPFHPDASLAVRQYRADDGDQKWAARCWGTNTCDGWLSLDHDTKRWAEQARDRHVAEEHAEPTMITDPEWLRQQYAAAVQPLLMDNLPKPIAAARAREIADTILFVRDRHLAQLRQRLELADVGLGNRAAVDGARTTPDNGAASGDAADNSLRERIAAVLSGLTVLGGSPPARLVPVIRWGAGEVTRIVDWRPLEALLDHLEGAIDAALDIGEEQAWCKTCRRVWEGKAHRCESDAEQQAAELRESLAEVLACLHPLTRWGGSVIGYQTVNVIPPASYDRWQAVLQEAGGEQP